MEAPRHPREAERLRSIERLGDWHALRSQASDDIARLACAICDAPMAVTSIIDDTHQWYTGRAGVDEEGIEREATFCQFTLLEDDIVVVPDARDDPRFKDNPAVHSGAVRFYAGIIIRAPGGLPLGTVCAYGDRPSDLQPPQKDALRALARQAELLVSLRLAVREMEVHLEGLGDEAQRGLNVASDAVINPMAAMSLQLAVLRKHHPDASDDIAKIEASLHRTVQAFKQRLGDAMQ